MYEKCIFMLILWIIKESTVILCNNIIKLLPRNSLLMDIRRHSVKKVLTSCVSKEKSVRYKLANTIRVDRHARRGMPRRNRPDCLSPESRETLTEQERTNCLDKDGGSPRESATITHATRTHGARAKKRRKPLSGRSRHHGRCAPSTGARRRDRPRNAPTQ